MVRVRSLALSTAVLLVANVAAGASPPKIVKGPWVQDVTATSAIVRVEVTPAAAVTLDFGANHRVVEDPSVATVHSIAVDQLQPSTKYDYSVHAGTATQAADFTTAPPDDSTAPFHFLAYGDNRTDDAAHATVVRAMAAEPTDLLIHTGDFVENGSSPSQWQAFFDIERPLLEHRYLASAVGNHELVDGSGVLYVKYFGGVGATKPEHLDQTFRWGNTRFFLVNGVSSFKPGNPERVWLERVLNDADHEAGVVWRIVVVHHGIWSSGPHGSNPRFLDAGMPALFKQHRVDLMLSGHDHIYERGVGASDLPFVVTGGGGAPVYKLKRRIPQSRKSESVHHFVDAEVTPTTLTLTALRADGTRIERCSLSKKEPGWFCGEPKAPPPDGGEPDLGPPEAPPAPVPPPSSRCSCEIVGAPVPPTGALALLLPVVAWARRRRRY